MEIRSCFLCHSTMWARWPVMMHAWCWGECSPFGQFYRRACTWYPSLVTGYLAPFGHQECSHPFGQNACDHPFAQVNVVLHWLSRMWSFFGHQECGRLYWSSRMVSSFGHDGYGPLYFRTKIRAFKTLFFYWLRYPLSTYGQSFLHRNISLPRESILSYRLCQGILASRLAAVYSLWARWKTVDPGRVYFWRVRTGKCNY